MGRNATPSQLNYAATPSDSPPKLRSPRSLSLALCGWALCGSGAGRFGGVGGWWHVQRDPRRIVRRSRQPAPVRLDGVQRAGGVHFSPHKSGSSLALRTPPGPVVAGARASQAAPPGPRPARLPPPAPARPLVLKAPRPGLRHRLRASARACGPVAAAAAHHFGWRLRCLRLEVSRSFVAVAAAPLLSRHPPHKKLWAVKSCEAVASLPPKLFPGPHLDNCSLAACRLVLVFLQKTSCACLVKR